MILFIFHENIAPNRRRLRCLGDVLRVRHGVRLHRRSQAEQLYHFSVGSPERGRPYGLLIFLKIRGPDKAAMDVAIRCPSLYYWVGLKSKKTLGGKPGEISGLE